MSVETVTRPVGILLLTSTLQSFTILFRFVKYVNPSFYPSKSAEHLALNFLLQAATKFLPFDALNPTSIMPLFLVRQVVSTNLFHPCNPFSGKRVQKLSFVAADEKTKLAAYKVSADFVDEEFNDCAIMYFHGGGYISGDAEKYVDICYNLSVGVRCKVYAVNYRLAPEFDVTCCLEDVFLAYNLLSSGKLDKGFAPKKIALAGDSAGGGLVLGVLQKLVRDKSLIRPVCAALLSPWANLALDTNSYKNNVGNEMTITPAFINRCSISSLEKGKQSAKDPKVSYLFGDFSGLPPLFICASKAEMLFDDSVTIAKKAREMKTEVVTSYHPHGVHIYPIFAHHVPEYLPTVFSITSFIQQKFQGSKL